jgi:hypothetical protein
VYPPHSIYEDAKAVTSGFNLSHDMHGQPEFTAVSRHQQVASQRDGLDRRRVPLPAVWRVGAHARHRFPWLLQSGGRLTPLDCGVGSAPRNDVSPTGGREDEVAFQLRCSRWACATNADPRSGRAYDRYPGLSCDAA